MVHGNNIKKCIAFLLTAVLAAGCGESEIVDTEILIQAPQGVGTMLESAEINYEVPNTLPGIIVDTVGYGTSDTKTAIIKGESLPAEFEVVDAETGETVFIDSVKRKESAEDDTEEIGEADFTDVTAPGTYYIKTEIYGRSKQFTVSDDRYVKCYYDTVKKLDDLRCDRCHTSKVPFESDTSNNLEVSGGFHTNDDGEKDVVEGCLTVMDILTAYEYYPDVFTDDCDIEESGNGIPDILDEAKFETKWLLKMQNPETGGVYTSVSYQSENGKDTKKLMAVGETTRATAYFAATMAKVSVDFKSIDVNLSQNAFQAAVLAWNCLQANKGIVTDEQMYRAATELYKATGANVYRDVILEYLKVNADTDFSSDALLDAAVTYVSTPRATDITYCGNLMEHYMSREEEKAELSDSSAYGVESTGLTADEYVRTPFELIVVDYIISSTTYVSLEKDYIHYLSGRNEESENIAETLNTPDALAELSAVYARLGNMHP